MSQDAADSLIEGRARSYHRRHHEKADGRSLFLYGYEPHVGEPGDEFTDPIATGSVLRHHPLINDWTIYCPHRQNRTFKPGVADDPLAPAKAGAATTEIPFDDFELAIFGNRFTSLHPESPKPDPAIPWQEARATGACDVVVYGPEPEGSLGTVDQARRVLLIEALIDRYAAHFADGAAYVLPFENRGDVVGVTLPHPHGQLYAFPHVPRPQESAASAFAGGYDLSQELNRWGAEFVIGEAGGVVSFAPPFARFPYEAWITPRTPRRGPWEMTGEEIEGLAQQMGEMTRRYDALFNEPMPYMMSFNAAPAGAAASYQFTVQYFPLLRSAGRVKYLASVEQATRVFTVDVMPERAAKLLREAI